MRNKNIILLNELENLLKNHDWYYAYSDDNYYYKLGREEAQQIRAKMEECINADLSTMANDIYNQYNPNYSEPVNS